ncbi:MAG: thiamine biosynthesis protein ApbE [Bacteroidetes bacterium HGW-Bacteroidetes-21]|jgi:thiamine biosynthesis lipoprotein|nr:MAG: thiamine biosynthesis protein ApbE [Bacteroidetes bacterium HGW-Bacteroidetes-21]
MKYFTQIVFFLSMLLITASCKKNYQTISGFTQGTTYQIKFSEDAQINQAETDSILSLVDETFSVYNTNSIITKINENKEVGLNEPFIDLFKLSQRITKTTNNYFNLAVRPLVTYWGFGPEKRTEFDSTAVDSILQFCDFNLFQLQDNKIVKKDPRSQLDVNAIAQGYSVDMVVNYLELMKIENYLVEIGGEVRAKGINAKGQPWQVGIDKPVEGSDESNRELQAIVSVSDFSLATSGSYRKFVEKDGVKYSHTINPNSGYPSHHNLLSVTITAPECGEADAVATAIMAMGMDKGKEFMQENTQYEAYFIFSDEKGNYQTWMTKGFGKYLSE